MENNEQIVPVVDLSDIYSDDISKIDCIADRLKVACKSHGFFYIKNHGVDVDLIANVFKCCQDFFNLPLNLKLDKGIKKSYCNRGYEPLKAQRLESGAPPDLKEGFYIGVELLVDDNLNTARKFNMGPNQWPEENLIDNFEKIMMTYFKDMQKLSGLLVKTIARSLDLSWNYFDNYIDNAMSTLRLLHYPPQPFNPLPREKGCGEHTDFGGITILLQDENAGLQVHEKNFNSWIDVPSIAGTFVVNLGDIIERWTNGIYRSTLHRVINVSGNERYSIPFFFVGNPDYVIRSLPINMASQMVSTYPPITVENHLRACYLRSYK